MARLAQCLCRRNERGRPVAVQHLGLGLGLGLGIGVGVGVGVEVGVGVRVGVGWRAYLRSLLVQVAGSLAHTPQP